ncbi:winged helix-turn-helix domain-containing protein [Lysobacter koreensis]|uniref:Winged helix-turn-helix domain-containing protein n=1 Tax=Lysobacter koreensis TaxID=266122 RepID=A0ABW2YP81_9GAMM
MPRPSEPPPQSSLSDRLRVGECVVDIPLREVQAARSHRPRRITPKSLGVLLALVEQAGRVVSREALLAQVWPDTLPSNDVVTQAITQLRKAFGEERGDVHYIETIAKTGYRLLAPVEWLATQVAAAPPVAAPAGGRTPAPASESSVAAAEVVAPVPLPLASRPRGGWAAIAGALAFAAVVVAATYAWSLRREASNDPRLASGVAAAGSAAALPYRLITSVPGAESAPALSPDAALVAYVAVPAGQRATAIMVQTTDPSPPRQLTRPPAPAEDSAPAWSPDGREIAFLRVRAGVGCAVMVVPSNGGTERVVGRCDHRSPPEFDWIPDGKGLVFGSRGTLGDNAGLRVLDLARGAWRRIEYAASADDIDAAPRYSPDGRWIVFVRNTPLGDFWRVPATGGSASALTRLRADIRGWDWTADGRGIVYSRWHDSESRLYRLDLDSGVVRDLGVGDGVQPSTAARAPALAFSQQRNYYGIYRFDLGPGGQAERLFPSSGRDRFPAIAPDGRQLVFASDRSGQFGLWWADLQQPNSLRLIDGVLPESRHLPEWSPDSRTLLLVGSDASGVAGIHEVAPASARVTRLPSPVHDPVQAVYLPGTDAADRDRLLVVAGSDGGRLRLTLFDRRSQPWRALAAIDDVAVVRVDHATRRLLFTRSGQAGLWQSDLALSPGSVRQVDAELPLAASYRQWTVGSDGQLWFIDRQPDCGARLRRRAAGSPAAAAMSRCLDPERVPGIGGFSISPRQDAAFSTLSQWVGGDIGFMALPEPQESFWPGVSK